MEWLVLLAFAAVAAGLIGFPLWREPFAAPVPEDG